MYRDLTRGPISRSLILFALPMMAGNLLQQFYNIADTLIVGRALGAGALAAVGSAYTLMTFLTSVFLGLSMGAGALFSIYQGRGNQPALRAGIAHALVLILSVTLVINAAVYAFLPQILAFLRVPAEVWDGMRTYLLIIFAGLLATSIYNYLSCLLRALGNSTVPLLFLAVSALLNVALDLLFVLGLHWGMGRLGGWHWSRRRRCRRGRCGSLCRCGRRSSGRRCGHSISLRTAARQQDKAQRRKDQSCMLHLNLPPSPRDRRCPAYVSIIVSRGPPNHNYERMTKSDAK